MTKEAGLVLLIAFIGIIEGKKSITIAVPGTNLNFAKDVTNLFSRQE